MPGGINFISNSRPRKEIKFLRNSLIVFVLVFLLLAAIPSVLPVHGQEMSAKRVVRKAALAYAKMESYQDVSSTVMDMGQISVMLGPQNEMMRMAGSFQFARPNRFHMTVKHSMIDSQAICDGSRLVYFLAQFGGQSVNQYIEKNVEDVEFQDVPNELTSLGQTQKQQADLIYSMLLAENPLLAFSGFVKSITLTGEQSLDIRDSKGQITSQKMHLVSGDLAEGQTGMKEIEGSVTVFIGQEDSLIHQVEIDLRIDLEAIKAQMPPETAGAITQQEMGMKITNTHSSILVDQPINPADLEIKLPEGAQLVEEFDMRALMKNAMGNMQLPGMVPPSH